MKKILTIIMLCGVCYGYAQDTPPYAASTKTWVIEDDDGVTRTWSDYINMPECNKEGGMYDTCHRADGIYYSYSSKYVKSHANQLCPTPWRLHTHDDYALLPPASAHAMADFLNVHGVLLVSGFQVIPTDRLLLVTSSNHKLHTYVDLAIRGAVINNTYYPYYLHLILQQDANISCCQCEYKVRCVR
jgi:hypothetical protein